MSAITSFRGPYRFLSNFWLCPITMPDGLTYPSAEHAYQLAKVGSIDERRSVLAMNLTPGQVKRYAHGQAIGMGIDAWNELRVTVMYGIVLQKFTQNADLKQKLLATGDAGLLEGNTWGDTFWGFCNGVGENHLGKILMRVRALLKEGA